MIQTYYFTKSKGTPIFINSLIENEDIDIK
jgi:hypothetical protein